MALAFSPRYRVLAVIAVSLATVAFHYGFIMKPTHGDPSLFHAIHGRLCYIPIIVSNDRIAQLSSKFPAKRLQAAVNLGELHSGLDQVIGIVRRCPKAEDLDGAPGAAAANGNHRTCSG